MKKPQIDEIMELILAWNLLSESEKMRIQKICTIEKPLIGKKIITKLLEFADSFTIEE